MFKFFLHLQQINFYWRLTINLKKIRVVRFIIIIIFNLIKI